MRPAAGPAKRVFGPALLAALLMTPGGLAAQAPSENPKPGESFRDCPQCPLMRVVPAGEFRMGDVTGMGDLDELPVTKIRIRKPFAIGAVEVTRGEWRACVEANGCIALPHQEPPVSRRAANLPWIKAAEKKRKALAKMPLAYTSWYDTQAYLNWLGALTGKNYRLPSEAEWEYAARAGTETLWPCGSEKTCLDQFAWHEGNSGKKARFTAKLKPNAFGLFDMLGNVWEWMGDCWLGSHKRRLEQDKPREMFGNCDRRVIRGGSYVDPVWSLRPARRDGYSATVRDSNLGFRVLREIEREG